MAYKNIYLKKGKEDIDAWVASKGDVDKAVSKAKDQVEIKVPFRYDYTVCIFCGRI